MFDVAASAGALTGFEAPIGQKPAQEPSLHRPQRAISTRPPAPAGEPFSTSSKNSGSGQTAF